MGIPEWLKVVQPSRSAFTGLITAVLRSPTFKLETAVLSMCICLVVHRPVTHAIVAVTEPEKKSMVITCALSVNLNILPKQAKRLK